ncbi:MAG: hypothetical protein K8R37_02705 [Bacteroidales bacterium]|nr:hypothetical protein [Bacteroidales bacterium]
MCNKNICFLNDKPSPFSIGTTSTGRDWQYYGITPACHPQAKSIGRQESMYYLHPD